MSDADEIVVHGATSLLENESESALRFGASHRLAAYCFRNFVSPRLPFGSP